MIYFDKPTQEKVVGRLSAFLEPGGYLFVGHAESLAGVRHNLEYVKPAVYRKAGTGGACEPGGGGRGRLPDGAGAGAGADHVRARILYRHDRL